MSKSIYEEAIKVVTYLQEQDLHLKDTTGTIYISTENIEIGRASCRERV